MVPRDKGIELTLRSLPDKPGVYQFLDSTARIIYVGKAKNLKKRVNSYFSKTADSGKTRMLVSRIADIKYIVVDSELDALLLENNLIKELQPKYNIQLKDDKTYPWICIKNEAFPRVFSTRKLIKDGSKYYGPYPSVYVINTLLELIREVYPLRSCALNLAEEKVNKGDYKVCLEYHIGNCKAPCVGLETAESYNTYIQAIENILKGNLNGVIRTLKQQMLDSAAEMRFEEAAVLKEKINTIERYQAKSTVVSSHIDKVDVLTVLHDGQSAYVNYLVIFNGAIVHGLTVEVSKKLDENTQDIITFVLPQLRERYDSPSKEVLLSEEIKLDLPGIKFSVPQRGDRKALVDLSLRNTKYFRMEKLKREKIVDPERHSNRILEQIKTDFRLSELPRHIECFDNSNFHGTNAVAACVVFKNAKPSKKDYRHFNIKTVEGSDDFASMEEVVYRRYSRMLEEKMELPQLIVIDGGKGQLSSALKALNDLNLRGKVAIVGIAKKLEEIYFPGDSLPIYIDKRSESLKVIQFMRNEAHRFGITHHRNKRSKGALISELTQIKGIGEKTFEELIKTFKSVNGVRDSTFESLAECVGNAKAEIIFSYFHSSESE